MNGGAKPAPFGLRGGVVVGIAHAGNGIDVVEVAIDAADQHAEVGGPAGLLVGRAHEFLVMVDGLGQRDFLAVAGIIDAVAAVGEPSRPQRRAMHEGGHDEARAGA